MTSGPSALQAHRKSKVERKLAAYLIAGGAAVAAAEEGRADIIYSGPQNISINQSSFALDLNGDGVTDYTFANSQTFVTVGKPPNTMQQLQSASLTVTPSGSNEVAADTVTNKGVTTTTADASVLSFGTSLSGLTFSNTSPQMAAAGKGAPKQPGNWTGVTDQFLGLRFDINGQQHYGWAELSVGSAANGLPATLEGWAYDTTANEPIAAGQVAPVLVPEPSSLALLAAGAAGLAAYRYGRRRHDADQAAVPSA
jgi:hypothetical protein